MKTTFKIIPLLFSVFTIIISYSQTDSSSILNRWEERTLIDLKNSSYGGYGALSTKISRYKEINTYYYGARGAWVLNHKLGVGLGAYGLSSQNIIGSDNKEYFIQGGYGGITIEPIIFSQHLINLSVPFLFGAGWIGQLELNDGEYSYNKNDYTYFVFEPGIELNVNVSKGFRVGFGGYYTIAGDIDSSQEFNKSFFEGFSAGIQLKWGVF